VGDLPLVEDDLDADNREALGPRGAQRPPTLGLGLLQSPGRPRHPRQHPTFPPTRLHMLPDLLAQPRARTLPRLFSKLNDLAVLVAPLLPAPLPRQPRGRSGGAGGVLTSSRTATRARARSVHVFHHHHHRRLRRHRGRRRGDRRWGGGQAPDEDRGRDRDQPQDLDWVGPDEASSPVAITASAARSSLLSSGSVGAGCAAGCIRGPVSRRAGLPARPRPRPSSRRVKW